jgi:hypothetical protein
MDDRKKLLLWCRKFCRNPHLEDKEDFSLVLDNMTEIFSHAGITSESLSDMSQSFGKETAFQVSSMLSPYRRVGMQK